MEAGVILVPQGQQFGRELGHGDVVPLGHATDQEVAMRVELGVAQPPSGLGARLPVARYAAISRTTNATDASKWRAASWQECPPQQSAPPVAADPASRTWSSLISSQEGRDRESQSRHAA